MKSQREGWLGNDYVRIYAVADRARVSELYSFQTSLPGYEPWGSWGLDALCLGPDRRLYLVDWIPLAEEFLRLRYESVTAFEIDVTQLHEATSVYEHFQKEVHFMKPLVFGGDPKVAPTMIDQTTHAEMCRFWNQTYARMQNDAPQ